MPRLGWRIEPVAAVVAALVIAIGVAIWVDIVPSECAAQARFPVPMNDTDRERLREIEARATWVLGRRDFRVVSFGIDEQEGVVEVGSTRPTTEMCLEIHDRYGPYIEITRGTPMVLFADAGSG